MDWPALTEGEPPPEPPDEATDLTPGIRRIAIGDQVDQHTDDEVIEWLRRARFKGAEYDRFEEYLVSYALGRLDAWLRYGRIFSECARIGRGLEVANWARNRLNESREDREDLAVAVVGAAIVRFRANALIGGSWNPLKGASITTYFMNWVIREFPNHFRKWQKDEHRWRVMPDPVPRELWLSDPAEIAAQRSAVVAELRKLSPAQQEVVALHYDGYTNVQIAEVLGKSAKAVERVLERWREKQQRMGVGRHDGQL